ncbi:MAG: hypothetical protein E7159_01650 [Firmicutes bacterium]|nr:hypothetical protein [Bacillota bacterium]
MNRLSLIKEYNPTKYTFKGKTIIFNTNNNKLILKESNKDINELFNYLHSRNFNNIPDIIKSTNNINIYNYIDDINYSKEQRSIDLINTIISLHKKTSYYKDVTIDKYKEIYDNILSNINYLKENYNNYYDTFFKEIYHSPSHYLFLRNFTKINNNLDFCKKELDNYYDLVKEKTDVRVSTIHNNLSLDHFIKSDKDYLISWDKSTIDIPILDIISLYKKEYLNINFNNLLNKYITILNEDEIKLLFILLSLPPLIKFDNNEFISCINIRNTLDYIYKTEELIRPYYLKNQKEE